MDDQEDKLRGVDSAEEGHFTKYILTGSLISLSAVFIWFYLEYTMVVNLVSLNPPYSLSDVTPVLSTLGSLALTLMLVLLYDRQAVIQGEQKELMSNQTAIMNDQVELTEKQRKLEELSHKPEVHVSNISVSEKRHFYKLIISNHGKGIAKDVEIEIQPVLDYPEPPEEQVFSKKAIREPYRKLSEEVSMSTEGCFIRPDEQEVSFYLSASLYISNSRKVENEEVPASFGFATQQLSESGKEYIRLIFTIRYKDIMGDEYEEEFADILLPIKGRTALKPAFKYGSITEGYENRRLGGPRRSQLEEDTARNNPM